MRTILFLCSATLALAAPAASAEPAETAGASTPALVQWQEHEFDFSYHGFTTHYSCDGLKYKMRIILEALGARPDPKVRMTGCEIDGRPALAPRAHIQAAFPAPLSGGAPESGAFPASFKTVTLSPRDPRDLEEGDCELVEQVGDELLPKLGVRVISEKVDCVPHQIPLGRPVLVVEVLTADKASLD
jgi:hypothetical protein